jgi:hypothetical protein
MKNNPLLPGRRSANSAPTSMADRLITALLAPLLFNAGIIICMMAFSKHSRFFWGRRLHIGDASLLDVVIFFMVPAIAGFFSGSLGMASLLGHAFLTHNDDRRSVVKTVLVWGAFGFCYWLTVRGMR